MKTEEKTVVREPRREPAGHTYQHLDFRLQLPELWENKFLFFKLPMSAKPRDGCSGKLIHHHRKTKYVAKRKGQRPNGIAHHKNSPFLLVGTDPCWHWKVKWFCSQFQFLTALCPKHSHTMEKHFMLCNWGCTSITAHNGQYLHLTNQLLTKTADRAPGNLRSRPQQVRHLPYLPPTHPSPTAHSLHSLPVQDASTDAKALSCAFFPILNIYPAHFSFCRKLLSDKVM